MTIISLSRKGLGHADRQPRSLDRTESYAVGNEFAPIWSRALDSGAEFALLIDDAVPLDDGPLVVMQRILRLNPSLAGITLGSPALNTVYGEIVTARTNQVQWAALPLALLPSWLSLLRIEAWRSVAPCRTPEFFLLGAAERCKAVRTVHPSVDFDTLEWAGRLLAGAAPLLASDWSECGRPDLTPPQFRIRAPGRSHVASGDGATAGSAPRFSVLMPSIRPDFLHEAVDSIFRQTYPDWELWIGIDGPKPIQRGRIADVLEPYVDDPRVHVRYHERLGTGPTRKLLSELAGGTHLIAVDDDDRLPSQALERFADAIIANPDLAALRGGTRVFGLFDAYLPPRIRYTAHDIPMDLFEATQPYVVRRDVLAGLGGFEWDPGLKNAGEDSDLFLKIDRAGLPIEIIDEPLYERRLSTLNQTLDCTSEECSRHVGHLYQRHLPEGWSMVDVRFVGPGPILNMWSKHRSDASSAEVVCSTRFMDFQQVGTREGVVVDLEVTSLCNAVCTFCPRGDLDRSRQFISLETVQRLAEELSLEDHPTVVLCGIGESTLHPELLQIVAVLAAAGANVCMTSNGSRLSVERLDQLVAAGLSELNISLNAVTAETHEIVMRLKDFPAITSACGEIAKLRVQRWPSLKFHLSFVVTAENEQEAERFVDQWDLDGVTQIWLHPLTNRTGLLSRNCHPGDIDRIAAAVADRSKVVIDLFPKRSGPVNMCHVTRGIDFISVEGDMLLCAQDYRARHRFGNVNHETLLELHRHKLLHHLRGTTSDVCSGCSFCPAGFADGEDPTYSIVQAGAV